MKKKYLAILSSLACFTFCVCTTSHAEESNSYNDEMISFETEIAQQRPPKPGAPQTPPPQTPAPQQPSRPPKPGAPQTPPPQAPAPQQPSRPPKPGSPGSSQPPRPVPASQQMSK